MTALARPPPTALPHWETTPDDLQGRDPRDQGRAPGPHRGLGPHGRGGLRRRRGAHRASGSAEIEATKARGETVWPVIDYADIEAGTVSPETLGHAAPPRLPRRPRPLRRASRRSPGTGASSTTSRATGFFENYRGPGDDFFGSVGSQARDLPDLLVAARRWRPARATGWPASSRSSTTSGRYESDGVQWFDPDRDSLYPDRIRRRPPGADSGGLGTHLDPGTLDLWMTQAYQQAFRHLFDGTVEQYDPWDAAHRTAGPQYPGTTMCSAFRTFQGWTALSDMDHDQGVLHTVPIPEAMAYLMLRPLLADVRRRRHVRRHRQPGLPRHREVAPAAHARRQRHPGRPGRRLRLVALRHDPQRRAGHATSRAGATSCTSRPRPGARATRRTPRSVREAFLHRRQPERLPRGALRAHLARPLHRRGAQRHRPTRPRPALSAP